MWHREVPCFDFINMKKVSSMTIARTLNYLVNFGLVLAYQTSLAAGMEFSADALQQYPNGQTMVAKMNVGQAVVRREYVYNQQRVIEIYHQDKGERYIILPQQKTYRLTKGVFLKTGLQKKESGTFNPCKGVKDEKCKLLAKEKIGGRLTDKWEVSRQEQGRTIKALMWIDVKRGQVLRQFFPDGSAEELIHMGNEMAAGRHTEKWVIQVTRPDGYSEKSFQWYDPELGIIIKEVMQGGYIRELRNIKTGKQPAGIFKVPSDYKEVKLDATNRK